MELGHDCRGCTRHGARGRTAARIHRSAAFGPHDLEALLTVEDVAALLRVSKSWVYEHTRARGTPRSGQLRHVKIGKYVRFEPEAVREFLAARARHI